MTGSDISKMDARVRGPRRPRLTQEEFKVVDLLSTGVQFILRSLVSFGTKRPLALPWSPDTVLHRLARPPDLAGRAGSFRPGPRAVAGAERRASQPEPLPSRTWREQGGSRRHRSATLGA